jgi:transglutaminase-like putative cysteine protease
MQRHAMPALSLSATIVLTFVVGPDRVAAQQAGPAQAPQTAPAPYAVEYDARLVVRADRTATETSTKRIKILTPGAIASVSQQHTVFIEGMQRLDTVEAFTEKADGSKVPVGAANIITRDAAAGQPATYARDLKQRTVIFPDVQVGDSVVVTNVLEFRQSVFPEQFFYSEIFPRSLPIASAQVVIEAPAELSLRVTTTGTGLNDKVEELDGLRRHTLALAPQPYLPEEARAVSAVDRDPVLLVSTFRSYEEMGLAYAAAALPKAVVTPEVAALADEITRGIDERRQQASAIDAWMKKNIRYVAVWLSLGRVVPNDAVTVLRNKYGDCKDKVTLMSALLAAKGIASEAVLVNFGSAYTLTEPPTMVALNHVILYLPEYDIYDDPTAQYAAFGVMALETYDKPVLRVGARGVTIAHTPAMAPDDHTAHARTIVNVAADGTVTGRTEETNTGMFGLVLRLAGANAQNIGETAPQRMLQLYNTPGTGQYDFGNLANTVDPANMAGAFTLTERFKPPAAGVSTRISFGLPQTVRPGRFLLGDRLAGRKSAFICYAGRQTEDIDATFDPGLPMPVPLAPVSIENRAFSYHATFQIEGRTLRMHREFVSRVPGQVCAPELEAQISNDLSRVGFNMNSAYAFSQAVAQIRRTVASDQKLRLDFLSTLNPDCTSMGFATVHILEEPKHGKVLVENGTGFTNFPQSNSRYECNKRRSDGVVLVYEPESGFTGADSINIDVIYASGTSQKRHYAIEVK